MINLEMTGVLSIREPSSRTLKVSGQF